MPCNYRRDYPPHWKQIRAAILARADYRCESCGVRNYAVGARDNTGTWWDEDAIHRLKSDDGELLFPGGFPPMIKIVLTVSHLDHNPQNNDSVNLRAYCQKCHLAYDAKRHQEHARATRLRKRGQGELFPAAGPEITVTLDPAAYIDRVGIEPHPDPCWNELA